MKDAIWLALGGMAITFAALSILLLVMVAVRKAFPAKKESAEE